MSMTWHREMIDREPDHGQYEERDERMPSTQATNHGRWRRCSVLGSLVEMKTHSEWVAYFRETGMDNGIIWHLMDGLYALRMVRIERYDRHVADFYYQKRIALLAQLTGEKT